MMPKLFASEYDSMAILNPLARERWFLRQNSRIDVPANRCPDRSVIRYVITKNYPAIAPLTMCRYTTATLSSAECDLYRAGGSAHQYKKWIYWLCRDSRDGRPCSNKKQKEDQIGNDFGPCPVCQNMRVTEEKYKLAVQKATEYYNAMVKRAYQAHLTEIDEAKYVVESVSHRL